MISLWWLFLKTHIIFILKHYSSSESREGRGSPELQQRPCQWAEERLPLAVMSTEMDVGSLAQSFEDNKLDVAFGLSRSPLRPHQVQE